MNFSVKTFNQFLFEKKGPLNEDDNANKEKIAKLRDDLAKLKNYHPQDDSPLAGKYGGYTIADSRRAIRGQLERLGGIKHRDPSPSAIAKRKESIKRQQKEAKDLKNKGKSDPKFKAASEIKGMQYMITQARSSEKESVRKYYQPKIDKLLKKGDFTSIANAVKYYNDNKPEKGK